MNNEKVSTDTTISKSAAKRQQRKKEVASVKRKTTIAKTILIAAAAIIVILIAYFAGDAIYFNATKTEPSNDFSAGLTDEGMIDGIDVAKYLNIPDYNNVKIAAADVAYTDEDLQADIQEVLDANLEVNSDTTLTVADGDKINLDYAGTVDGVAFDGGTKEGGELTIGSNSFIDDFETQLIGTHPGDTLTVEVTFPDTYTNNPDLAGKDASFEVTVNGIYQTPAFTDEFVTTYLADYASTTAEYETYLKETNYESKLETALIQYISDNASAKSYPKDYLKILRSTERFSDEYFYTYYNDYLYQTFGYYAYSDFWDYIQLNERGYEKKLRTDAKTTAALNMTYQYIFETEDLTVSDDVYSEVFTRGSYGTDTATVEENYGKGFLMQQAIQLAVIDYLETVAVVE